MGDVLKYPRATDLRLWLYPIGSAAVEVVGTSHHIEIERSPLGLGMLHATILNTAIDPTALPGLRPGAPVEVYAIDAGSTGQILFTGEIEDADVTYHLDRHDSRRARIEITALDAAAELANLPRQEGTRCIRSLPFILAGSGVAWNCDGRTGALASLIEDSFNESASALDQIVLARDTNLGYAWLDRTNTLQAWTALPDPADELVPNGGFESTVTYYNGIGTVLESDWEVISSSDTVAGSWIVDSAQHNTGTKSLKLIANAAANQINFMIRRLPISGRFRKRIAVKPGVSYKFAMAIRSAATSRNFQIMVDWYDGNGIYLSSSGDTTFDASNVGAWKAISHNYTAPTGAVWCNPVANVGSLFAGGRMAAGETHWIDDVSVKATGITVPVIDEDDYSDLQVGYGFGNAINQINVTFLRYNSAAGTTEEIPYGPYEDAVARAAYKARAASFTIHNNALNAPDWEDWEASTLAVRALENNSTPKVAVTGAIIPIRSRSDVIAAKALADLYDLQEVKNTANGIDQNHRITSIKHIIDSNDGWLLEVGYDNPQGVAAAVSTPSVAQGGAGDGVWQAAALAGAWVIYGGAYAEPGYVRENGWVTLRGVVKTGTGTVFTLPVGFRPAATEIFVCDGNGAFARVTVTTAGLVAINVGSGTADLSLSGIRFKVAA